MTGRLPFDPANTAAARRKQPDEPLSVSALATRIDLCLKQGFSGPVRVVGEVSGFRERTHWYFDLKDETAVINCVLFASRAGRSSVRPQNGHELVVTGSLEFYAPGGKVSLVATSIQLRGAGELELRYRALCEELRSLGWFAPERKRPLPSFPRKVAVVTSRTGAALQDVLDTFQRRMPAIEVVLVDVRVQGPSAAPEVAQAIHALGAARDRLEIDAILVTRGGGSMEDLWAFNERIVAEAIVHCPLPVVAAIGHETDTTIAELVADERCATPTQAAMRLSPDRAELARQLSSIQRRLRADLGKQITSSRRLLDALAGRPCLVSGVQLLMTRREHSVRLRERGRIAVERRIARARQRLDRLRTRLEAARPQSAQARKREQLGWLTARLRDAVRERVDREPLAGLSTDLHRAVRNHLRASRARLASLEAHLGAVSPQQVLDRGYSITTDEQGRVVRSTRDVGSDAVIDTRVADGSIRSRVEAPGGPRRSTPAPKPRPAPPGPDSLFG